MKVEFESNTQIVIDMGNGKSLSILDNYKGQGEIHIVSQGEGHRNIKEVQHRLDGYSSVTLTKQE